MDFSNWTDLQGNQISPFIQAYRDSLQNQNTSAVKQLNQARRNAYATINSGANKRGMLYSNFPERDKIKYNTVTYMPTYVKAQQSYQTGLDTLRSNMVNLWNQIKAYNESIGDLNTYGLSSGSSS